MTRQPELAELYPEVGAAGTLVAALQRALDEAGHPLTVVHESAPGWRQTAAQLTDGNRSVSTHLAIKERAFLLSFWERNVQMAHGITTDLADVAGATATWQSGARVADLASAWPFVGYDPMSEAYESGDPVAMQWQSYRERPNLDHDLIEAAYAESALRMLFPFSSVGTLAWSRCTRYPYAAVMVAVDPRRDGVYRVHLGSGAFAYATTPQEAIALVVAHLPPDLGPAIDGTADDLPT
ncbi:DUF6193 family natural product biosynthesis protein [Herbidospora sp. RD11066]